MVVLPRQASDAALEGFVAGIDRFAGEPGFGKVVVDYDAATVRVLWKGLVPASLSDLIVAASALNIAMAIEPADYSFAELNSAGLQILDNEPLGIDVTSTMPNADFSGLALTVAGQPASKLSRSRRLLAEVNDIPITRVSLGGGIGTWTRQNDSAPWRGGGGMVGGDLACSVGFAVVTPGGGGRLPSASHCDPGGQIDLLDAHGDVLSNGGDDVDIIYTNDTMLIDPVDGTTGVVHGGPWNAGTGHGRYRFRVVAKSLPAEGTPVCTSGANTGEHCSLVIHRTGVNRDCGPNLANTCHGFIVRHTNGGVAGGPGDSGGPVYYDRGDGTVGARGILIGPTIDENGNQTYKVDCPNSTWTDLGPNAGCGSRGFVIGYQTLENDWNVAIELE